MAGYWQRLCVRLGILQSQIEAIEQTHPARGDDWLIKGLTLWLRRKYNTHMYGPPSWKTLIECVNDIDGALAEDLAKEHRGNFMLISLMFERLKLVFIVCSS